MASPVAAAADSGESPPPGVPSANPTSSSLPVAHGPDGSRDRSAHVAIDASVALLADPDDDPSHFFRIFDRFCTVEAEEEGVVVVVVVDVDVVVVVVAG